MSFVGKVAFVTGAASGIGLSCTRILLERGARVVGFDRAEPAADRRDELRDGQGRLRFIRGDASSGIELKTAIDECLASLGRLDLACNCAGVTGPIGRFIEQDDGALDQTYAVNMRGVYLSMKYEAKAMAAGGAGAIVNVASEFGMRTMGGFGLYGATKFGVVGLTQMGAVELAEAGIRVNAVAPGPIKTPFIGPVDEQFEREHSLTIPQRRFGLPDEVALTMLWLASPEASYVTGAVLAVDGGQTVALT
jgi:NAD(P)-dependent dehydrogenase (short-subunit alcohol dehydrogenase family)